MTACFLQMPMVKRDANGHEIRPGMYLTTDDGDRVYVISLPCLHVVQDQGSREANLAYAAQYVRDGKGKLYPLETLLLSAWEIET